MASPRWHSGFMIEGSGSPHGPFELVAAPTNGCIVHWWRDNSSAQPIWRGGTWIAGKWDGSDSPSLIQAAHGPLEVLTVQEGIVQRWWRNIFQAWIGPARVLDQDRLHAFDPNLAWGGAGAPAFIQGRYGSQQNNYEAVVPLENGGLVHLWQDPQARRDFDDWSVNAVFARDRRWNGLALIHSTYFNDLDVVAADDVGLSHIWQGKSGWTVGAFLGLGRGRPGLVQGTFGQRGNFEVVAAHPQGGLVHYWRDNDAPSLPWSPPTRFGQGSYSEVSLIQSTFDGHLEVAARSTDVVDFYWRENGPSWTWHGPCDPIRLWHHGQDPIPITPPTLPTPLPTQPDLGFVVFSGGFPIVVNPPFPEQTQPFTISWAGTNYGGASAAAHHDRVVIVNQTFDAVMYDETFDVPVMSPGQTAPQQADVEGLAPGSYQIVVHLDSQAEVADANPGNNQQTYGLLIQ